jgi:hypothetical protein
MVATGVPHLQHQNAGVLPTTSEVRSLVLSVEKNPAFVSAENGTSYQYAGLAGFGSEYANGTVVSGEVVLYFNHYEGIQASGGPVILSQLQVYSTMKGEITRTYGVNDSAILNIQN